MQMRWRRSSSPALLFVRRSLLRLPLHLAAFPRESGSFVARRVRSGTGQKSGSSGGIASRTADCSRKNEKSLNLYSLGRHWTYLNPFDFFLLQLWNSRVRNFPNERRGTLTNRLGRLKTGKWRSFVWNGGTFENWPKLIFVEIFVV